MAKAIRKKEKQQIKQTVDYHEAIITRYFQHANIDVEIIRIAEELGLQPEKVLDRFESRLKIKIIDILKTNNIIANRGHKRKANVVAAGFIYKVYRNKVTI